MFNLEALLFLGLTFMRLERLAPAINKLKVRPFNFRQRQISQSRSTSKKIKQSRVFFLAPFSFAETCEAFLNAIEGDKKLMKKEKVHPQPLIDYFT